MKNSYLTAGMKSGQLFRLIRRNRISSNPQAILRILFLIQSSLWSGLFSLIEKIRYPSAIDKTPIPANPIFIIGHWRTGSTFLHQLMSLDPNLAAPTLFQVAVPDSFLISYNYYKPIFKTMVGKHRPMDMVKLGMDEPQEDEYAIYRITDCSPLENIVFPKTRNYFLLQEGDFVPPPGKIDSWSKAVSTFYRKLYFKTGKTIVSKNPFNSLRIPMLNKLFPEARFIHIGRNPLDVVPSTINMWDIVQQQNSLNDLFCKPQTGDVVTGIEAMHKTITKDLAALDNSRHTSVRFEDLEANPAEEIKRIYSAIGLPCNSSLLEKIEVFLESNGTFRKNSFSVCEEDRRQIAEGLPSYMDYFRYQRTLVP